ncbi:uncharacterized protein isoform X2 [Choristoneura fumiferana]|uniref:uncharacterized protein isoform X2 n=1 Tax=Choristoneura fumiferana TaxID=7141 RepID=UPI003D156878
MVCFQRNVVHRDLKLGNIVLNQRTGRITITNFCLGTHLGSDRDLLKDQRGSPAYISPDVLMCKPYLGKPSDMWALGVVLYTMLYGQFPFCDTSLAQLFSRIQAASYNIPPDGNSVQVSDNTVFLIQRLLVKDPKHRLLADEVLDQLSNIIATSVIVPNLPDDLQVVPEVVLEEEKEKDKATDERKPVTPIPDSGGDRVQTTNDEVGVYCVPLPDFLALNFPPAPQPAQSADVFPAESQRQITVQRIGRDARPLSASEIARYQHMFTSSQPREPRADPPRQTLVPDAARPENPRLRALAQRIPRLNPIVASTSNGQGSSSSSGSSADFRVIPWSERSRLQFDRSLDQDYVLRLPVLDLSRIPQSRIMNPAPVHTVNLEAVINNPRPPADNNEFDYN